MNDVSKDRPVINISLQNITELYPEKGRTAYSKKIINEDIAEYIIREARANGNASVIQITIPDLVRDQQKAAEQAVRLHFTNLEERSRNEVRHIFQLGWRSLLIGFGFLFAVFALIELLRRFLPEAGFMQTIHEVLIIIGWVALWRPAELLLYEWYMPRRNASIYKKIAESNIQFEA